MPSFRFPLETVLALRERQEKDSAAGLAEARRNANTASKARDDLRTALEAGRARLAEAHGAGSPVGHLCNLEMVLGGFDDQIREADQRCRDADEQVGASMKEYHQAFQHRRTLEQLKSHRLVEWQNEQARGEQRVLDELALNRHGKGRGERGRG